MSETILVTEHGNWVEITLNRPDRLNSFNDEMHLALRAALETAWDKGARAILLTGAGRGFCAGQDLGDVDPSAKAEPDDLSVTIRTYYTPLIKLLREMDMPVVCAVNGVAAGAGANIALACDIVLASENAKFIQSFVNVGLVPDAGGTWALTRLLGEARAKALAMTGAPVTAAQAAEWGMIWQALPEGELMEAARKLTDKLANGPTVGLGLTKAAIQAASVNGLDDQLELEAECQKQCGYSADYAEGVSAFLQKRKPDYQGR